MQLFREQSGAAALCGRDLPPDEALAANASVTARAMEYKDSGAFPGARMDQFRAAAYLDLIKGMTADARIALGYLSTNPDDGEPGGADALDDAPEDGGPGTGGAPNDGGPADTEPASPGQAGGHPVLADLVIPLATLLGLAERPGEAHGLGVLDPGLCRDLAALAAASPHTRLCITVTDPSGIAIGHGCGRIGKLPGASPGSLPARVNLTITADRLSDTLAAAYGSSGNSGRQAATSWALTWTGRAGPRGTRDSPDDPEWCDAWTLTLPGGRQLPVRIEPVPSHQCDHRYESHGYQPNDTLRHLVQVRDHMCTFPPCSRHAKDSDFEHARPYGKGGRTCSCNAGARSRKCHRIKQSPGWNVTQPKPGWHVWTTPSGRIYTQAPYRYPV